MPYQIGTAANHVDLLDRIVRFVGGYASFSAPAFTGTGTGQLLNIDTYPGTVTETWTVTCTATAIDGGTFSVVGAVSGAQADAVVGANYDNGKVRFNLTDGSVNFQLGDQFVFTTTAGAMGASERWEVIRYTGMAQIAASSFLVNWEPWAAFKGPYHDHANGWSCAVGQIANSWLSWKSVRPIDITRLKLKGSATAAQSPREFKLQWSDDGATWYDRKTWSPITWTSNEVKEFAVDGASPGAKLHWRIFITLNNGDANYVTIQDVSVPEFSFTADFDHSRRPCAWLKAPGMTGLDPCFINFQVYDRPTNDVYNIAVTGTTGFVGAADFDTQPGALTAMGIPLWNQAIPYWLSVNGQRVIVSAKVDTAYLSSYAGKMLTFGTPAQYPYPLLIAAPLPTAAMTRYSDASVTLPYKGNRANMKLRKMDGAWVSPFAWPYTLAGGGAAKTFRDTDGAYPLLPITLHDTQNTYGVLDGLDFITGFGNAVENTVTIGAETHIVLQDGTKNGLSDFFTMRVA